MVGGGREGGERRMWTMMMMRLSMVPVRLGMRPSTRFKIFART